MPEVSACIITAAGASTRFGEDKIFKPILGRPLVEWSLKPFLEYPEITEIILVFRAEVLDRARSLFKGDKIRAIVSGGETRELSVLNGFREIKDAEYVLVHDGDRPCLTSQLVRRVLEELKSYPAVIPAYPVKETIKACNSEMLVSRTLGKNYWCAQTPQGFKREILEEAFQEVELISEIPDDSELVEKLGLPVKVIRGEETNIKVTTPFDFKIAEMILKERAGA
jgi:2-C-methyl-D-erythritol 4-phosphate cytidylyltransferase